MLGKVRPAGPVERHGLFLLPLLPPLTRPEQAGHGILDGEDRELARLRVDQNHHDVAALVPAGGGRYLTEVPMPAIQHGHRVIAEGVGRGREHQKSRQNGGKQNAHDVASYLVNSFSRSQTAMPPKTLAIVTMATK